MKHSFRYGDERIDFVVQRLPSPRRRVTIHVLPDGAVRVDAPEQAASDEIIAAVRQRARWIWLRLEAQRARVRHVLPREYVSGESHFYLGRRHLLKVTHLRDDEQHVKLLRGKLVITTADPNWHTVRDLLDAWYKSRAEDVFRRRLAEIVQRVRWLKTPPPFRLRNMRTQWGSCSPKGGLLLNPQLVKAPGPCIDYVLCHELCHLKEHNHSAAYYRLLDRMLPDWQRRKLELDGMAEQLLNR